jgi:hypothetical protein
MLKWYGMNPNRSDDPKFQQHAEKFEPIMSLGLSMNHPQAKFLSKYLELSNISNPFLDKSRWTSREISWKDDLFINFGLNIEEDCGEFCVLIPTLPMAFRVAGIVSIPVISMMALVNFAEGLVLLVLVEVGIAIGPTSYSFWV